MVNTLYLPELREMLAENNAAELEEFCTALHPARTAEFMEGLSPLEAWDVLKHAELPLRVQIFSYFDREMQIELIRRVDRAEMARFIGHLPPDDRVDILKEVDPEVVDELLPLVPAPERRDILRLRAYPENTAGAVMTTDFAHISEDLTVREALDEIGRQAGTSDLETIYYIYVTDDEEHLLGLVSARQLVSALKRPDTPVRDLMERDLVTADVNEDQEEVARKVADYDLLAIPVVDHEHRLLGIITHDDVIDVVQDEATEDAYRLGGVVPMEERYLTASFVTIWRKRAFWLSLFFVAELFTFNLMASFETTLKSVIVLSMFLPLCISTGGNTGSQAATLITRALALGEVKIPDWFRVFLHELLMGLALGLTLGVIGFFRAAITTEKILNDSAVGRWELAAVISVSVASICLWGTLVGSLLPLLFKRMGIDPGIASTPFVATFVDLTGIFIYLSIAHSYLL
ncbi:MAG: magnesium transporter [Pirellulales bacterium]|nr:magnesium transporter [Pirellulales bacterium]